MQQSARSDHISCGGDAFIVRATMRVVKARASPSAVKRRPLSVWLVGAIGNDLSFFLTPLSADLMSLICIQIVWVVSEEVNQ